MIPTWTVAQNCAQWPCLEMILIKPCSRCQHFQVLECRGSTENFFCTQSQHSCSCFPNIEKSRNTSVSMLRCWKLTKEYASNSFTQIDIGMSGPKHREAIWWLGFQFVQEIQVLCLMSCLNPISSAWASALNEVPQCLLERGCSLLKFVIFRMPALIIN